MSVSAPFINRPIATSLLMAGILLVGIVAFPMLPVAPLPQVDFPTIQVTAQLPGASPDTMATSVATPLEYYIAEIPGVTELTSSSVLGTTQIVVQFDLNRNIDAAAQDVEAAIANAAGYLPKDLPAPPSYKKVNPADSPIIIYALHSDVLPVTTVNDYADSVLAQQLSRIKGVGQVNIWGQLKPAIRVQIDPRKIAALGIDMEDVANVINDATVDAPKGFINGKLHEYTIYDNDQLLDAKPWNDVIVAYRNGAPVRVRDIGTAIDGPEDVQRTAYENGKRGAMIAIMKQPGANVIDVVKRVEEALPQIMTAVPPAIKLDKLVDRTLTIRASVDDVEFTLVITVALVMLVIFLFLRNTWATVIPGITVPLALFGTCAAMYVIGYSLDNLSLMALTIAVGFVVDDAIVMLENCYRHVEAGLPPYDAAMKGAGEIGFTIMSISLSLIAVFIPLLLMGGIVGRLFHEFAITVTATIVISAFVSLTLSPTMCALFLRNEKTEQHGRAYRAVERVFDRSRDLYAQGLDFVLRHQRATLAIFLGTAALSIVLYVFEPKGFFPQEDTGLLNGVSDAPEDVSFGQMDGLERRLGQAITADPAVSGWVVAFGGGSRPINNGFGMIALKPHSERHATADEVIRRLRAKFAHVPGGTLFLQVVQDVSMGGHATRTQYQYTLTDANDDELNAWGPRVLAALQKLPELSDVASDQQDSSTKLAVDIDRDEAARFGIQPAAIDQELYDAFGEREVTQYFTQLNTYHVVLEITPALQRDPNTLNLIYMRSPATGQMVPLSQLVRFDTRHTAALSINHESQFPAVTLSFNLAPGAALGQAVDAISATTAAMHLPAGLSGSFQGTAQAFQDSLRTEPYLILAAIVVVYIILGMLYESYIHPLTILSTLPSAGVGALLALLISHIDFTVIALIGVILLIGIVKKNGIMMVDFALQAEREEGLSPEESIRKACLLRYRPIMMTTMAALLGALPLALGTGTGSEIRQPLGYTMVGGLLLSQTLTLFTTPVIYLYLDRLNSKLMGHRKHAAITLPMTAAPLPSAPVPGEPAASWGEGAQT